MFFGFWEIISRLNIVPKTLFPAPSLVLLAIVNWGGEGLWRDTAASLGRAYAGMAIGVVVGIIVGVICGRYSRIRDSLVPIINLLRPLPPVALIPVMIVWLGLGNNAKIVAIAYAALFPAFTSAFQGALHMPPAYDWAAKSLGMSRTTILWRVVLPSALNVTLPGIRGSIAMSFVMVFVTELAGSSSGIGYRISLMNLDYRMDAMMGGLVVLGVCAACTDAAVLFAIHRVCPWLGKGA